MAWRLAVPREWEEFSFISSYASKQPLADARSVCAPTWHGSTALYPDLLTANLMNHFRMGSIAVQTVDLRCTSWIARYCSADRPTSEVPRTGDVAVTKAPSTSLTAQNVIRTLVDGICASVPFYLEKMASKRVRKSTGRDRSGKPSKQTISGEVVPPSISKGEYILLQPFVVAYSAPGVPVHQKQWIQGKIVELVKHVGMDEKMVEKTLQESGPEIIQDLVGRGLTPT